MNKATVQTLSGIADVNGVLRVTLFPVSGFDAPCLSALEVIGNASVTAYTTLTWDNNGNRTYVNTAGGNIAYTWDDQDRLVGVVHPTAGTFTMGYGYDGLRLWQQNGDGSLASFVYDGENVLSWQRGPVTQWLVQGDGNDLIRSVGMTSAGTGLNRQYHADGQGTTAATTTGTQAIETGYQTDAWGNTLAGSAVDNPYIYGGSGGYWQEPDLGLTYVGARWLDAQTGSWLSVDPIEGEPAYGYAYNAPTVYTDPSGRQGQDEMDARANAALGHLRSGQLADGDADLLLDMGDNFITAQERAALLQAKLAASRITGRGTGGGGGGGTGTGGGGGGGRTPRVPRPAAPGLPPAGSPALAAALHERAFQRRLAGARDSTERQQIIDAEESGAIYDLDAQRGVLRHNNPNWFFNKPSAMGGKAEAVAGGLDFATFGISSFFHRQIFGREIDTQSQNYKIGGSLTFMGLLGLGTVEGVGSELVTGVGEQSAASVLTARSLSIARAQGGVGTYLRAGVVIGGVQGVGHLGYSAYSRDLSFDNNFFDVLAIAGLGSYGVAKISKAGYGPFAKFDPFETTSVNGQRLPLSRRLAIDATTILPRPIKINGRIVLKRLPGYKGEWLPSDSIKGYGENMLTPSQQNEFLNQSQNYRAEFSFFQDKIAGRVRMYSGTDTHSAGFLGNEFYKGPHTHPYGGPALSQGDLTAAVELTNPFGYYRLDQRNFSLLARHRDDYSMPFNRFGRNPKLIGSAIELKYNIQIDSDYSYLVHADDAFEVKGRVTIDAGYFYKP